MAFSFKQLQDTYALLKHLEQEGFSVEDFMSFMEKKRKENDITKWLGRTKEKKATLSCPFCGKPLRLGVVNNSPANQIEGDFHSVLFCIDYKNCGYQVFSSLSFLDVLRLLREGKGQEEILKNFEGV